MANNILFCIIFLIFLLNKLILTRVVHLSTNYYNSEYGKLLFLIINLDFFNNGIFRIRKLGSTVLFF